MKRIFNINLLEAKYCAENAASTLVGRILTNADGVHKANMNRKWEQIEVLSVIIRIEYIAY